MSDRLVIASAADLHLNILKYKGVMDDTFADTPFRHADFMNAFSWVVDKAINEIKPDLFVIPGDVVDHHSPTNILRGFFSKQLEKFNSAKIPVIILIGNHDVCSRNHALEDISQLKLKNIKVIEEPTILSFKGANLFLFPYSLEVEKGNIGIKDQFMKFLERIKETPKADKSLFFGHFGVRGAKLNEYDLPKGVDLNSLEKTKRGFINKSTKDISVEDLDALGVEYVILGDYHQHQRLQTKNCYAMYTGSIEKTDISEADQIKGFVVYDSEAEEDEENLGKCRFIQYPNCRPLLELKGNMEDIKETIDSTNPFDKRPIVKISFVGSSKDKLDFNMNFESLRREIFKKFNPIHFFHTIKTVNEEEDQAVQEIKDEIMEKGKSGSIVFLDVIVEGIKDKVKDDEDELNAVISLAKEIDSEINS